MNKPKVVVVVAVALIVVLLAVVLIYFRGIGVSKDNFTISFQKGATEDSAAINKQVVVDGDKSLVKISEDDSVSQRGLKTYEIEDIQAEVARLNIRWGKPDPETACKDQSNPDSYLQIESGNRKGIIFFCEGIGADEVGNISGPYQDLIVLLNETSS